MKVDFLSILALTAAFVAVAVTCSQVQAATAPSYPDVLSLYIKMSEALEKKGCVKTQPELSKQSSIQVYDKSALASLQIRAACIKWAAAAPSGEVNPTTNGYLITWTAPTTLADGSELPASQIAGYKVFMDGTEIGYTAGLKHAIPSVTGVHKITLITVDTYGFESVPSAALSIGK